MKVLVLFIFFVSFLYTNKLKNREFDKETPQNSCLERATIAFGQGASEDKDFEVKPMQSKPDSSGCLCIHADLTPYLKKITEKNREESSVKNVDFIYLINLDHRPEKLEKSLTQLGTYGITPYRFSAIYGWDLPASSFNDVGVKFSPGMETLKWALTYPENKKGFLKESSYGKTIFGASMTPGTVGCSLSHLSVLQDAVDAGYETIWVMEDDILVEKDPKELSLLIEKLDLFVGKGNWDVLYTDLDTADRFIYSEENDFQTDLKGDLWWFWRPDLDLSDKSPFSKRSVISRDFIKIGSRMHAHSMILRRSGMEKILKFEKERHLFLPYDHEIAIVPNIQLYSLRYNLITSAPAISDIRTHRGAPLKIDRAVTYGLSGGRLGDNLLAYLRAKWISYQFDIPLLYHPFPYSNELSFGSSEQPYREMPETAIKKISIQELESGSSTSPVLYVCPYFSECAFERKKTKEKFDFQVDWKDAGFRKIIKPLLKPRKELRLTTPPEETVSVAIHFREGGDYDAKNKAYILHAFAVKFPPFEFYIEGLLKTAELFKGKTLYCYLFTDTSNPEKYLDQLKQAVPKDTKIIFDCRAHGNSDNKNVLEDFFSLFNFDVLIHPQSNFSLIPSLIHDYAVVYAPLSAHFEGQKIVIDQVKFEINEKKLRELR